MKALMILDSYEHTTNNEKLRLMTIKLTTFNLTTQEFKNFVDRVRLYQLSSGLDFVKNFEKFQNELHLNAHSSDMSTVSLYSPAVYFVNIRSRIGIPYVHQSLITCQCYIQITELVYTN